MDVLNGYRDSHNLSSDDDSEDSDEECTVWKRATAKKGNKDGILPNDEGVYDDSKDIKKANQDEILSNDEMLEVEPPPELPKPSLKRKRNNIWSEVLQDQLISEDLEDCLLKNKPRNYGSRGKESYDYTLSYKDPRSEKDSDSIMSDNTLNDQKPKSKMKHSVSARNNRRFVKLDSAELAAAVKINKVLNEKKYYLIQRIVKMIGIEKAMTLLSMTEEIEENGGMMIKSNTRRRTPGGVYIQLLKNDKDVTQKMLDEIFEGEMSGIELKNYYAEKRKNGKKFKKKQKQNKQNHQEKINKSRKQNESGSSMDSNRCNESSLKLMEHDSNEIVPMDAEVISNTSPEKSTFDNLSSVPVPEKNSVENNSDLEEGEIED